MEGLGYIELESIFRIDYVQKDAVKAMNAGILA